MRCSNCNSEESKVIDSRSCDENNSIRRRRECLKCGKRFTTYETIEVRPVMVIKQSGIRQPFDVSKIKNGVMKACEKRPISMQKIDKLVNDIEREITNSLDQEVTSTYIGEMVMTKLKELDQVAYVRFAAVYKQFKDVSEFLSLIEEFGDRVSKVKNDK